MGEGIDFEYHGDWKHGKMHGHGTLINFKKEGGIRSKHTGYWKDGLQHGRGLYRSKTTNGTDKTAGFWKRGKRYGLGTRVEDSSLMVIEKCDPGAQKCIILARILRPATRSVSKRKSVAQTEYQFCWYSRGSTNDRKDAKCVEGLFTNDLTGPNAQRRGLFFSHDLRVQYHGTVELESGTEKIFPQGQGMLQNKQGVYDGSWKKGTHQGYGSFLDKAGGWREGFNGYGVKMLAYRSLIYRGVLKFGKRNGFGITFDPVRGTIVGGEWQENRLKYEWFRLRNVVGRKVFFPADKTHKPIVLEWKGEQLLSCYYGDVNRRGEKNGNGILLEKDQLIFGEWSQGDLTVK